MRTVLNTLAKMSLAHAIASKAMEHNELEPDDRELYKAMAEASKNAIMNWPGANLTPRSVQVVQRKILTFTDRMGWESKPKHIQTYLWFSLAQLEGLRDIISDPERKRLVEALIEAEMAIYVRYSDGLEKEKPMCAWAGLRAAKVWDEVMEG